MEYWKIMENSSEKENNLQMNRLVGHPLSVWRGLDL